MSSIYPNLPNINVQINSFFRDYVDYSMGFSNSAFDKDATYRKHVVDSAEAQNKKLQDLFSKFNAVLNEKVSD